MPNVLITLDTASYRTLKAIAANDERAVDQQARFLLRRAIQAATPNEPSSPQPEADRG